MFFEALKSDLVPVNQSCTGPPGEWAGGEGNQTLPSHQGLWGDKFRRNFLNKSPQVGKSIIENIADAIDTSEKVT